METDKNLSNRFRNMSVLCACMVVVIHSISHIGVNNWLVQVALHDGVCCIAVPFFFFTSGFFLARHVKEKGWWWPQLKRRLRTLLIPALLFGGIYCVGLYLNKICNAPNVEICQDSKSTQWATNIILSHNAKQVFHQLASAREDVLEEETSSSGHVNCVDGRKSFNACTLVLRALGLEYPFLPFLAPLWYIRALLLLVFIAPLIVLLLKSRLSSVLTLSVFFLLYLLLVPQEWSGGILQGEWHLFFRFLVPLHGLFYFSLGIVYRLDFFNILFMGKRKLAFVGIVCGMSLLAAKTILLKYDFSAHAYFGSFACLFLMLGMFNVISSKAWPTSITSCSFPIYLSHMLVVTPLATILRCKFAVAKGSLGVLPWVAVTATIIILTFTLVSLQRCFLSRINDYLYGGR